MSFYFLMIIRVTIYYTITVIYTSICAQTFVAYTCYSANLCRILNRKFYFEIIITIT